MDLMVFYHNRWSHRFLYFLVILACFSGLALDMFLLDVTGISRGMEFAPAFVQSDPRMGVWIIFGSIPIFILLPFFVVFRFWSRAQERAVIEFREQDAVLSYRGRKIVLDPKETKIRKLFSRVTLFYQYEIRTPQEKILLTAPIKSAKKGSGIFSLDEAMGRLEYLAEKGAARSAEFYGMRIILWNDTPQIFDKTPYYLDRRDMIVVEDGRITSCTVRERRDPLHVVGDLLMNIEGVGSNDPDKIFEDQVIIEVLELDERIPFE